MVLDLTYIDAAADAVAAATIPLPASPLKGEG
jgi:hypothetical protein